MARLTEAVATVSQMPFHDGDGYSWGGDAVLTIGERSFHFGSGKGARDLAEEVARRWNSASAALEERAE
jgi:hypothetical protein